MVRTAYTTIGGGLVGPDKQVHRRYLWLKRGTCVKKRTLYRRSELKALPGYSLLNQIATAWNALSGAVKSDWNDAGAVMGQHGYNLFVQDKAYRIMNDLAGNADPSIYHQYLVGHLNVPQDAALVLLRQTGSVVFDFPATIYCRRKTALLVDPPGGKTIKIRFKYTYDEGGGELTQTDELTLDKADPWGLESLAVTEHYGLTGDWELEIEVDALKGDFWFDDLWVEFPSGILTKDPYCLDVKKHWSEITFPAGVSLETIYPTGDAL